MRLASIKPSSPKTQSDIRDGHLAIVSADGKKVAPLENSPYPNLRSAIEDWKKAEPILSEISSRLNSGSLDGTRDIEKVEILAPLPRSFAFLDGSAFINHVILARKSRGAEPPEDLMAVPLMYQGMSDSFLGPHDSIPLLDESYGLDFEGEIAVILGDVPQGTTAQQAPAYILLLMLLNDISLRNLIPRELAAGFGFLQSKPASSCGPFAVTPDELADTWKDGRVHLPLTCKLNGKVVGTPSAGEMHFSFFDLIAHAAKTRPLGAGTIIASGTISNQSSEAGVACLVERRMREIIEIGQPSTPYLKCGDQIEIEISRAGKSVFGKISNTVSHPHFALKKT